MKKTAQPISLTLTFDPRDLDDLRLFCAISKLVEEHTQAVLGAARLTREEQPEDPSVEIAREALKRKFEDAGFVFPPTSKNKPFK